MSRDPWAGQDFRDLLDALQHEGVRFLVAGAHALGAHGVPRATADLDIWLDATQANAERVWRALARFGAPLDTLGVRLVDLSTPDQVIQLGLPPARIDLLTGLSGVSFEEAWPDRLIAPFGSLQVPFVGRTTFLRNKRATGRLRDLADIEALGEDPTAPA